MKFGEGVATVTLDGVVVGEYRVLSMEVTVERVERAVIQAVREPPDTTLQITIPSRPREPKQPQKVKPSLRPRKQAQWKRETKRYRP